MSKLYNIGVYYPHDVEVMVENAMRKRYEVIATRHAEYKIAKLRLPNNCYKAMLHGRIVEVEIEDGRVNKIITRLNNRYNSKEDLCAAILLGEDRTARVKTIWINRIDDSHKTIRIENYERGILDMNT